ncbi:AGE family epimerase/isomerase [Nocardioides sp. BGMRC 2183]|nr:AGE family epimerase/isomerase [Nocardioides sp. BGMRC 2183]
MTPWLDRGTHRRWLDDECRRLIGFSRRVAHPAGGAAYLTEDGTPDLGRGVHTWITARMLHVHSLGAALGLPGCTPLAQHMVDGLHGSLRDTTHGGWHHHVSPDGAADAAAGKSCYDHAFVLLGLSSGSVIGLDGADRLLADASAVFLERFWDDAAGRCRDGWSADWSAVEAYRGLNANMHAVEAMLAVADATDDPAWRVRAERIAQWAVDLAGQHDGRLPEHFDEAWTPLLDHHRDRPDDPFKPYGATVGHGLEWSRLLLHVEAASPESGRSDLLAASRLLFDRAVLDGWAADGRPGFVYTTDWTGAPVVTARMHWVAAEAIAAAAALYRRTGEESYLVRYREWWDHVAQHFIDTDAGSWWHQLDPTGRPVEQVWPGKPDLYHAVQATLLPRGPLAPSLTSAVADGYLG